MLTLLFMFYWHDKYKDDYFRHPKKLAVFISFLLLTRGFVVIPLTIFLFKSFEVKTFGSGRGVFTKCLNLKSLELKRLAEGAVRGATTKA